VKQRSFLMCPPEFFDVSYVINPWMHGNMRNIDNRLAKRQWRALYDAVASRAVVRLMHPQPSSPDMVFTANAGLVYGRQFIVSRFRHEERQAEEPYFSEWFVEHGYEVTSCPADLHFEGAGDALFDRALDVLWMAHGHRSAANAATHIGKQLGISVQPLELVDERFYHLDTCFCPLPHGELLYYPPAFAASSAAAIEQRLPATLRLACSDADAVDFACNAVTVGSSVIVNRASPALVATLTACGYTVIQTALSEFMKAGGSAKCLTLDLDESGAR